MDDNGAIAAYGDEHEDDGGHDNDNDGPDDNDVDYDDNGDEDADDPVFLAAEGSARREQFEERGLPRSSCVSSSDPKRRHPPMLIDVITR